MTPTSPCRRKTFLILSFLTLHLALFSQEKGVPEKISLLDRMQQQELLSLEITTNINALFADWRTQNYHWGKAKLTFTDGEEVEERINVKVRGKYRSKNCKNPPIKIKYSNKSLKERNFKKLNEYKLVYPCKSTKEYQRYVMKEYLIYKLYNELTLNSLRVQLVDLTLTDSLSGQSNHQFKGFLIEHWEELIYRMEAVMSDLDCMPSENLNQHHYTIFQLFQYLIGNTDWVIPSCKNAEIIATQDGEAIPVPYDFDFSGMVDAAYAVSDAGLGLTDITQRYFKGEQKSMEELAPILKLFQEKRRSFTEIIEGFEYLPKKDRKNMIKYLNSFYRILDKPKKVQRIFCTSDD